MTLERHESTKRFVFTCDDCGEEFETHEADFNDAIGVFKDEANPEGWQAVKDDDTDSWMHYCPSCNRKRSEL